MKIERNRVFLLMAGLSFFAHNSALAILGFGGSKSSSTVKQMKSLQDATQGILGFNIGVYGDQNFLVSVGLKNPSEELLASAKLKKESMTSYKNKRMIQDNFFASMEDYIQRNDSSLMTDFKTIKNINAMLFDQTLTHIYEKYIAPNIIRAKDKINGLSGQDTIGVRDKVSGQMKEKIIPRYTNPEYINLKNIKTDSINADLNSFRAGISFSSSTNTSGKLDEIISRLNKKLKEYRGSVITNKVKGDAVAALISLAGFINQHCASAVTKHFNALKEAKANVFLKELAK